VTYVWALLLTILNGVCVLLVALGLPGTWLMVLSTLLVAWWQHSRGQAPMFTLPVLVAVCLLALAAELFEFLAGVLGSKAGGGSRRGAIGALVGAIVGGVVGTVCIPLPIVGSLIGACGGAAIGALGMELHGRRTLGAALRSGAGAGVGRLLGSIAKLTAGALIWITVTVAAFWP
jgi:uncharacterized protein